MALKTGLRKTGAITRQLEDVARVTGSQDYSIRVLQRATGRVHRHPATPAQRPRNRDGVLADLEAASRLPGYHSIPTPTEHVQDLVNEVQRTLIEAIAPMLVIVIFLQELRRVRNHSDHCHPSLADRQYSPFSWRSASINPLACTHFCSRHRR